MQHPLVWALLLGAATTAAVLADRWRRGRPTALDLWSAQKGLPCERRPALNTLSPLEPLALLPTTVVVERLVQGVLRGAGFETGVTLFSCLVGNKHQPRRFLLGVFASHQDLPPLRLLPTADREAPDNLGFVPLSDSALPTTYVVEGFTKLSGPIIRALTTELSGERTPWRIELRPGRLILASPIVTVEQIDAMVALSLRLQQALVLSLSGPPDPPPGDGPVRDGDGGDGLLN